MNIHEYQAKAILKAYGAPVAEGVTITDADEAREGGERSARSGLGGEERRSMPAGAARAASRSSAPDAKGGVRLAQERRRGRR